MWSTTPYSTWIINRRMKMVSVLETLHPFSLRKRYLSRHRIWIEGGRGQGNSSREMPVILLSLSYWNLYCEDVPSTSSATHSSFHMPIQSVQNPLLLQLYLPHSKFEGNSNVIANSRKRTWFFNWRPFHNAENWTGKNTMSPLHWTQTGSQNWSFHILSYSAGDNFPCISDF